MATITITASNNIKNITYATGDTLLLNNSVNPFVRLTIDAQDAADVTKVETFLPALFSISANAELYVVNTSTTVPLIVKLSGENNQLISGNAAKFRVRGDWISLGTGDGTDNQSISVASVGGKLIDWPPFVEVETSAGSGVYVMMLNIGGYDVANSRYYRDGYAGSGLTPTSYPAAHRFSECGSTRDLGYFFEFDEENSTIHFGSAAGGGWVPPNGSNIRIPNIHFTGTLRPNTAGNARIRITTTGSQFDLEVCSFSNRWGFTGSQFWPYSFRARHVGLCQGSTGINNTNGPVDIDYLAAPLDLYTTGGRVSLMFATATGPFSIDHFSYWCRNAQNTCFSIISNPVAIGEIRGTLFGRTTVNNYAMGLNLVSASEDAPITIGPLCFAGASCNLAHLSNLDINGFNYSDTPTGVETASNTSPWIGSSTGNFRNTIIRNWRLLDGGCPPGTGFAGALSVACRNLAIHDIDVDGQNKATLAAWQRGFDTIPGKRLWLANISVTDNSSFPLTGSTGALAGYPARVSNYHATNAAAAVIGGGFLVEGVFANSVSLATTNVVDASIVHLMRTTGRTVGTLILLPGNQEADTDQIEVISGTADADFWQGTGFNVPATGVEVIFTGLRPIRSVTGASSAVVAFSGANSAVGLTHEFRLRNAGESSWPSWATLDAGNFTSAFNALSGYDSDIGFEIQYRVTSTSAIAGRVVTNVNISALDLDAAWEPAEVGFIEVGYTGATAGASVAVADITGSPVLRGYVASDSDGDYLFEYPYGFVGLATDFKIIARKAGYVEVSVESSCFQAGASIPVGQILVEACTDADVADIAANGATEVVSITASKTLAQLYQDSQWWAHQEANMLYPIPVISGGNGAYTAAYDVTVGSGFVLNGAGSLALGASILSTEFAGGSAYTYTGGTWQQATTVPSFAGGTLEIGAAGTYVFAANDTQINITPAGTTPDYDLSGCTLPATVDFDNNTAHAVTIELPAGVTGTDLGSGGAITFTSPTVERGLEFVGLVAGSQVVVCTTGTQTEQFRDNASGTTETWDDATAGSLTVDYTIMKAGYLPIRVTGVVVTGAVGTGVQTVPVQQVVDRAYAASSGLTWGTTATVNAGTKEVTVGAATTVQNWYSKMIESWIAQSALVNVAFPFSANGPNSFTLGDGWVWGDGATSIAYLSRDGMRYTDASGNVTAMWAAILSVGVPSGMQARYQQADGTGTTNAANTGEMDQLVQILSDPNGDGAYGDGYDRRGHLVLKVQAEGYDEAAFDAVATYGALEDQFYVAGLAPVANGIAAGGTYTGLTLTDGGMTPVTWNGKDFSLTITDTADARSGTEILQWIRNTNAFNYGDLVRTNGDRFRTVRGAVYGDVGATLKGVRVVKADGTTPHPDFNLFTADDGTTYTPPVAAPIAWADAEDDTTVLLYNDSDGGALIDTQVVSGGTGYLWDITLPHADVSAGDTLRLRHGNKEYYAGELTGVMTANGLTFAGAQTIHPVYATWALDGADYDQANGGPYTMDGPNVDIDIGTSGALTKKGLGAWTQYLMTLPAGLDAFYGAFDLLAANQIRQNVDIANVLLDNTSGAGVSFSDQNVNYYRSDFSVPWDPTGDALHMGYDASPFLVETGVSGLTGPESAKLDNLDVAVSTRLATAGYTAPTTPPTAAAIRAEIDANSTKLDVTVGSRLAAASYTAPDNAGIAVIRAKVIEMHELEGLDDTKPLVVTETSRTVGTIEQTITENAGTVTVERQ